MFFLLSFIGGVILFSFWPINNIYPSLLFLSLVITIAFYRHKKVFTIGLAVFGLLLGLSRGFVSNQPINSAQHISQFNDQEQIEVIGLVVTDPVSESGVQEFTLRAKEVKSSAEGLVLLKVRRLTSIHYGDVVTARLSLLTPAEFEDFSYKDYLSRYHIYSVAYYPTEFEITGHGSGNFFLSLIYDLRRTLLSVISRILSEPASGLLVGILLGIKSALPENLLENFNTVGLTHIVVVSGFNITIIAHLLMRLTKGFSRNLAFWLAVIGILAFIFLTGAEASIIRAATMGILVLIAGRLGRQSNLHVALILTAAIMIWQNPRILQFDVGFQLSFLATAGLVYIAPILQSFVKRWPVLLGETLASTASALIMASPIIVYNFERLSLVAPLSNLLVLPIVPLAMLVGFVAVIFGLINISLGILAGTVAWVVLHYIILVANYLSRLPLASISVSGLKIWWLAIYYLIVLGSVWWWSKKVRKNEHKV